MITNKELCECGAVAVWDYMPGFSNGRNSSFCNDCVPRGCECNHIYLDERTHNPPLKIQSSPEGKEGVDWKWIEKDVVWTYIDEKGREYPCVEYMYDEDGWDI